MKLKYCILLCMVPMMIHANKPQDVADGNNRFAFKLFHEVQVGGAENQFYSPFSISTAMAMVYAGARNETALQIGRTMNFRPGDSFHAEFNQLLGRMNIGSEGKIRLDIANGMWVQNDYKFLMGFLEMVRSNYNPEIKNADFKNDPEREKTLKEINSWVEQKTHDKIRNLLNETDLDSRTRLVLVNAIYFYGEWAEPFKKESTRDEPFNLIDGLTVTVPFMNQHARYKYFEDDKIQAVELPYKDNKASMVIFLPKKISGITETEKSLNYQDYLKIMASSAIEDVQLSMPKFEATFKISLGSTLSRMGMPVAFTPGADFSGMTGDHDLSISEVIHQAFIHVDEMGTEAAAATAVVMRCTSAMAPVDMKIFKADHPFIFLIRDNETGSILFMGKVMNP